MNEDFELTAPAAYNTGNAVTGWTVESTNNVAPGIACAANLAWNAGSPEFSIVATPILATPYVSGLFTIDNVTIPNSPLGGTNIARLNDTQSGILATRMISTFPVTSANSLFQFAYAGSWHSDGHACCDQPSFTIRLYNCPGAPLTCSSVSLTPTGPNCANGSGTYTLHPSGVSWTNWIVNYIDLSPFIGTCVTIEVVNSDCTGGAHHGSAYFDSRCGGSLVPGGFAPPGNGGQVGGPVSFCSGSNVATINAPLGYSTYQWFQPGNPPTPVIGNGGNTPTLSINNPVPGTVYTVQLVTASGCTYTAVDTLAFSSVNIAGIATNSSCPGGASGSATVVGNGSGAGYTYTWTNSSGVVLGYNQGVGNLAQGIYSVTIGAFGGGCGTAGTTLSVGQGPPGTYTNVIPFCGNEAYLSAIGSNFQWYNGTTLIPAANGGTAGSYTATAPTHGQIYRLSYQTAQGCQDSVTFILSQTPSGSMYTSGISYACPSTPNATASVFMTPALGAPVGYNSYSVVSIAPTPAYSASLFPTASNNFPISGLSPGTYSVIGFDGACKYTNTFVVQGYVYDYVVSPSSSTLCPGSSVLAGVSFSFPIVPGQFSYLWSPNQFMLPGNNDIAVVLSPTTALGTISSFVYSVTVTPAIVNCPITKTISVTAANLQVPTINPIPAFCTNAGIKTITVSAPGGTFTTGQGGNWLNGNTINSANFTAPGTYSFQYAVSFGTCMVSNAASFNVSQFNTATLTAGIANLCVTNPCVNLMGIVQSTVNGGWNGLGVANNTFCPSSVPGGTYILTYTTISNPNPNLCPDMSTIAVVVSPTVAPFITAIEPFCTNKPPIQMTVTPAGGTWSYQGPAPIGQVISAGGLLNRANAPLGNSNLIYSLPTGACINTATTTISATLFRSAALTGAIPDLCFFGAPVNLMSIVSNTISGVWSGNGVTSNGVLTPSTISNPSNPAITGYYTYRYNTYSAPNANVCPDSSKIVVYILKPAAPTITQPQPHCITDAPFQLTATPNTGYFTAAPYLSPNGLFTPGLSAVGNNQIEYTVGTNTCNIKDVKVISIEAFVPATITGSVGDQCSTNPVINLSGLVQNNTGSWSGPGITGSTFDPATSGTGPIVITYNTKSIPSGLCPDSQPLTVNVYSLATPLVNDRGPYCNSMQPVQLIATPLGGTFEGDNTPAVGPTGIFNPASAVIGDNIITYSVTAGPCQAMVKAVVKVEAFVPADFTSYVKAFCRNEASFDLNSLVQNPGGQWSGDGMTGSIFNPANANIGNNNFVIYETHSVPTYSLCKDTSMMRVNVNDIPKVSVVSNKQKGCAPVEVVLNSPDASGTGVGKWYLGDGSEPKDGLSVSHIFTKPGTYTVTFNYKDAIGCDGQAILPTPIVVHEVPVADFNYGPYEEITISEPEVQFSNQTTVLGNNTYQWQIGNLYQSNDVNPYVVFPKIGKYEITLTATSVNGCKDKVSHVIEIKNDLEFTFQTPLHPMMTG